MISFRKKTVMQDLTSEAIEYLKEKDVKFNIITEQEADQVSSVNSKSMVLRSFILNENGFCQIKVQEKNGYGYTKKLLGEYCRMNVLETDKKTRITTAECKHLGMALDVIELLGIKYNLSIVQ